MEREIAPGVVAHFCDGGGHKNHRAVILSLSPDGQDAWALFLTSNPSWNRKSRQATRDELGLCGFASSKQTFFAPVIRPTSDASVAGVRFDDSRLHELRKEFGPDPFAPLIFTLPDDMYPPARSVRPQMPPDHLYLIIRSAKMREVVYYDEDQTREMMDYLAGRGSISRSDLKRLVKASPDIEKFFGRRPSSTLSLQMNWERIGKILTEFMAEKRIPRKLLAARMGLTEKEILAFEVGVQCPSFTEMLTISALLEGLPEKWSLPCTVPLFADCINLAITRIGWNYQRASSVCRIPYNRLESLLVRGAKPSNQEIKRFGTICRDLPPWRPFSRDLDDLDDSIGLDVLLAHAKKSI